MNPPQIRKSTIRRSALAIMLGLCLSQAPNAFAQATNGDVVGTATYASGAQIQITNPSTGFSRTVTLDTDGKFRIPALPTGQYKVQLVEGGNTVASQNVTVVAGQTSQVSLTTRDTATLTAVKVKRPMVVSGIDTSSVESRSTFTAQQLNELPVPRDVSSVARLTPGTSAGSGYFGNGNLNSFGGASVAENSYYVNGMNVTNSYDSLSFSEVPWQAIDQLDVQTGGYGAEYGFSTGGVTSVNIKRGTNEWHGGVSVDSAPDVLRSHLKAEDFANGDLFDANNKDKSTSTTSAIWVGGPLIKDKLFVFAIAQDTKTTGQNWAGRTTDTSTTATEYDTNATKPYELIKLDWFLNDWNHIEFTGFDNSSRTSYAYYNQGFNGNKAYKDTYNGNLISKSGGPTDIFKWTSNLTDDLTLEAQYGKMRTRNSQYSIAPNGITSKYKGDINGAGSGCPYVYYSNDYTGPQNSCYISSSQNTVNGFSQRQDYRLDLDWTLGDHDLRFGYDYNNFTAQQGSTNAGGHEYYYDDDSTVEDLIYKTGGKVKVKQHSWYAQDHWHVTDNFLLSIGVRNDSFKNYNTSGEVFVKQNNIWQPRLGFSWDTSGDGTSRLYGNLGRYALPIAANVALRAASASIYSDTVYSYTGVSADGTPTGTKQQGDTQYYNGENGETPDANSVASKKLKPYTQDEAILGFQHTLASNYAFLDGWVLGAKATYRKIHNAIDDSCSTEALYDAANAAGYDTSGFEMDSNGWSTPSNIAGCWLYNPGKSATISTDVNGDGSPETVTMSASSLGPKAKRTYKAVTLSAEKATERWYGNISYTWSQSKGNYEGLVKSNNGQDDTGTTADFDFAQIMQGAYGYLPNDHRHSLKAYGGFKITPEWQVGVDLQVQSGAPISCYGGGYGTLGTEYGYGAQWHYCNGAISKEGSQGRTPWTLTLSPNVVYRPKAFPGVSAQLSVMNLFDSEKPLQVYQSYENVRSTGTVTHYEYYKLGQYYQDPRYVRLQLQYDW